MAPRNKTVGPTPTRGGGILNEGTLDVRGATFSGNSASDSGGAIYDAGMPSIQGSTRSGNSAGSEGDGIFDAASGTLTIKDSTVLGNSASLGADLYSAGLVVVDDSIMSRSASEYTPRIEYARPASLTASNTDAGSASRRPQPDPCLRFAFSKPKGAVNGPPGQNGLMRE